MRDPRKASEWTATEAQQDASAYLAAREAEREDRAERDELLTLKRWGRITEVRTLEDTAVLQATLDRLAAAGFAEAHAAPITD